MAARSSCLFPKHAPTPYTYWHSCSRIENLGSSNTSCLHAKAKQSNEYATGQQPPSLGHSPEPRPQGDKVRRVTRFVCPLYSPFPAVAIALSASRRAQIPLTHSASPPKTIQNPMGTPTDDWWSRATSVEIVDPKRRTITGAGGHPVTVART